MKFDIHLKTDVAESFRTNSVKGKFDLDTSHLQEHFVGDIPIENLDWKIGLIYGNSGTGKSTISKKLFGVDYFFNHEYSGKAIIDEMHEHAPVNDITNMFNKVGFSSPPSWLKPYHVLSNGEKMRVDLARCLLSDNELIVFDEYTSVIDRNIAKVVSICINKVIKNSKKRFVAVTCHDDVLNWLLPDWSFNTNEMKFALPRGLLQRPRLEVKIFECKRNVWNMFKKHHYLNGSIAPGAKCYCLTLEGVIVGFTSLIYFVHGRVRDMYRAHRTVVLPDYQGIGLSKLLRNTVFDTYMKNGYRVGTTLSNPALMYAMNKDPKWKCTRKPGRILVGGDGSKSKISSKVNSSNRLTTSWEYVG